VNVKLFHWYNSDVFKTELQTSNPSVSLVAPDVDRDAALGVKWLDGDGGRQTLGLMGVEEEYNKPSSLEEEKERVQGFLENNNQFNWMINFNGEIVGAIWVDLESTEFINAPAVSLMIGDPEARGKGVGEAALKSVINFLREDGHDTILARHLTTNQASAGLLGKVGFQKDGNEYAGDDGFHWQNMRLQLSDLSSSEG
jgi:RimJ/RimL family protein N-acetyltransferase